MSFMIGGNGHDYDRVSPVTYRSV